MEALSSLEWLRGVEGGSEWLDSLDGTLEACADHWGLALGPPFPGSHVSLALPADMGGEQLVLKIQFPHRESDHESEALRVWAGEGAIRLIDEWPDHDALLLERCVPGHHLSTARTIDAVDVMCGLVERLGVPARGDFTLLQDEVVRWVDRLPGQWEAAGRPFERRLVDAAVDLLESLALDEVPQILIHQDLHGDNVLAATREPWLAIDPKPLVGDPAFAPAPIIRSHEFGHSQGEVVRRLDRLSERLGLDRDRVRGWAIGQTVAWSIEGTAVLQRHVDTARWLLEALR